MHCPDVAHVYHEEKTYAFDTWSQISREERCMLKAVATIVMSTAILPSFCQTASEHKAGTITTNTTPGSTNSVPSQQQTSITSTELIGLIGVKQNAEGNLTIEGSKL